MSGDFAPGKTVRVLFNTHTAAGAPITLAGTPAISVYKDGGTTESTAGVTLTVDFDSRTGLHLAAIDTSADGSFYAAGSDFAVVITTGTVDAVSVVGTRVGGFSLSNRSHLRPTTADRTLDVTAGGCAGLDWANVEAPTTTLALTGTTIATTQKVDVETIKTQAVTCAAGVTVGVYVGGTGAAALEATAQSILTDTAEIGAAGAGLTEAGGTGDHLTAVPWNAAWDAEVQSEVQDAIEANNLDHLVKAAVDTNFATTVHLDSVIGHLADAGTTATFDRTTDALEVLGAATAPTAAAIADAVWDETLADHLTGGSTGAGLNSASSAGDPWGTALPGAYSAGSAGHILGNRLVGTIATGTHNPQSGDAYARLGAPAGASVSADVAAVKTQTAAIETDTQDIQSRLPAALSGGNMPSVLADGVAHGGTSARLVLGASGSDAAFDVTSTGDGGCLSLVSSGANANPLSIRHTGKTPNHAVYVDASTTTSSAAGVYIVGSAAGIYATADAGPGIRLVGGSAATGYSGFLSTGGGAAGSGMELVKAGLSTGVSLLASDGITGSITGSLSGSTGDSADIDAILEDTGTTLPAQIAALNNLSAAQVTAAVPTAAQNAAAVLAAGDVDGFSLEETLKLCLAALAGKLSGATTATVTIRSADDSANRIVATVDSSGNRSAVTLNAAG